MLFRSEQDTGDSKNNSQMRGTVLIHLSGQVSHRQATPVDPIAPRKAKAKALDNPGTKSLLVSNPMQHTRHSCTYSVAKLHSTIAEACPVQS